MNFSQRNGLEPVQTPFQTHSMTQELRNSLWNAFDMTFLALLRVYWDSSRHATDVRRQLEIRRESAASKEGLNRQILTPLWVDFLKFPLPSMPANAIQATSKVTEWFLNDKTTWNRVYEFVEFVAGLGEGLDETAKEFVRKCNKMLEREGSAYRFVGKTLSPITTEAEIRAIEVAASTGHSLLRPVSMHIEAALKLLSNREKPDYRNSMKESILAVEAVCKIIAQSDKATLGPALDIVKAKVDLHPKLQEGFKALYSYTSDDHGIRHALKDDAEPEAEDARFLLVTCSGFVNYLIEKARKNDLLPKCGAT